MMNDSPAKPAIAAARDGFRWPAEWEPHDATWTTWPHNPHSWPGRLPEAEREFAQFVRTLVRYEPVKLLLPRGELRARVVGLLGEEAAESPNLELLVLATNDSWVRDYGPTFLRHSEDQRLLAVDWRYNAWGGKYPPWDDDAQAARRIAQWSGAEWLDVDVILEGGAIDGNGAGTVLTTETCLLNPNRNPDATRERMEQLLAEVLGARRVCWLSGEGIEGDDTDGHIDQLARFVAPHVVVAACCDDPEDPQHAALAENLARLRQQRAADDQPLEVHPLPVPSAKFCQGQRLPASYCNFYIANGAVLVPQFDDAADRRAMELLSEMFPDRQVLGVPALELVWGLGAFHCLTQQQPSAC